MAIIVRPARDTDAEAIAALNADIQTIHAAALPWRFKAAGSLPRDEVGRLLANPDNLVFVAEDNSVPVGYAYAQVMREAETPLVYAQARVYLHHIGVRPTHRRQGAGDALLAAVRAAATKIGIDFVVLDVWTFNVDARAFFERRGFTVYNQRMWTR